MLIGDCAVVGLHHVIYFDHLNPSTRLQDPLNKNKQASVRNKFLSRELFYWGSLAAELPGIFAPDDVADIGRPPSTVDAGRKESRVYKIKVVRRKCE